MGTQTNNELQGASTEHHSSTHHSHSGDHHSHSSDHRSHSSDHHSKHKRKFLGRFRRRVRRQYEDFERRGVTRIIGVVLSVMALALVILAIGIFDGAEESSTDEGVEDNRTVITYNGHKYVERDDLETIMLIGIDKYIDDANYPEDANINTSQNDFNVILVIDDLHRTYKMMQINRDTMTLVKELGINSEVVGERNEQLALAHTFGNGGKESCRNVVDAVSKLLFNTKIDNFLSFTMDAIPVANDAADGISVLIEDDFSAIDETLVKGQEVTLYGEHALHYLRARQNMDDQTNVNRMNRHRTYIKAFIDKANKKMKSDGNWASKTLLKVGEYLTTDITKNKLVKIADKLNRYKQEDVQQIKGELKTGSHVEFYPDTEALKGQVVELFYEPSEEY